MSWDFVFNHLTEIITAVGAIIAIWRSEAKGKSYEKAATIMAEEIEKVKNSSELKDKVAARMRLSKAATEVAIKMVVAYIKPNTPNPKFWQKVLQWAVGGQMQRWLSVLVLVVLLGCATTSTNTVWEERDDQGVYSKITYHGKGQALFPSKIDKSATSMSANGEGKTPWRLKSGQNALGTDASQGLELFEGFMRLFGGAVAPAGGTP